MANQLLDLLARDVPPPFALISRQEGGVELFTGSCVQVDSIADIPRRSGVRYDVLCLIPYRQIRERDFEFPGPDQTPLTAMVIDNHESIDPDELRQVADSTSRFVSEGFDIDDESYANKVNTVLQKEIGAGAGANFVLSRSLGGRLEAWNHRSAAGLFTRLLFQEAGTYWTFLIWTGDRALLGASPERHVALSGKTLSMNPISGTLRFPEGDLPSVDEIVGFIENPKEANELYMVLDEELKMVGRICRDGGKVDGPFLKWMSSLAHTEYFISGETDWDPRDVLRETMFAPTVIGGPLESACRAVSKHEIKGRGYYAGVAALIGTGEDGCPELDSTIIIRTADIDINGQVRISVGATLVRDSVPHSEAAETNSKARGLVRMLRGSAPMRVGTFDKIWPAPHHPRVQTALSSRNSNIAQFWFADPASRASPITVLRDKRVLIIDAEDAFTEMAKHLIRSLGANVSILAYNQTLDLDAYDLVILGPGPGDPTDFSNSKIVRLRDIANQLLAGTQPFFAVCLGHQILSMALGLNVRALPEPSQGVQKCVTFAGRKELVGFYNTFAVVDDSPPFSPVRSGSIRRESFVGLDGTRYIHSLHGSGFASVQFHPASILTVNGHDILGRTLANLLSRDVADVGWRENFEVRKNL